jgi:hypothetical protein
MRPWGALLLAAGIASAQDGAERMEAVSPPPPAPVAAPAAPQQQVLAAPAADSVHSSAPTVTPADSAATRPGPVVVAPPATLAPDTAFPALPRVVIAIDTHSSHAAGKSVWLAAGLSLALPGAGEQYLGAPKRARFFITAELFYVAAAYLSWRSQEDALTSAREIANRYAGAQADGKSASFLELMSQYRSRRITSPSRHDSYDEAMLVSGESTTREFPESSDYNWDWGSTENPDNDSHLRSFESQMRTYRASRIALNFSVGAMVVSRLLSLADILWIHRTAWVQAEVTPTYQGAAGRLAWRF